jgi:hypothetical protein
LNGNRKKPAGSRYEVKELIEPETPTWRRGKNHRSSTIDLFIASNKAQLSMAEIATDLYTGSDHETLCWEIDELDGAQIIITRSQQYDEIYGNQ